MPAQIVLDCGSKPAQIEIAIGARNNEGGLAVPVLSRNVLHEAVREKSGKDANARRITCKKLVREYVNVVIGNRYVVPPQVPFEPTVMGLYSRK